MSKFNASRAAKRVFFLTLVPAFVLLAVAYFYLLGGRIIETDNAYIKADKVPVSASVAGMVSEVLVAENQAVVAGQVLYRLDPATFQVSVEKSQAKLAQARTELNALKASHLQKQAEITPAKTRLQFALKEQQRQADLVSKNFVSAAKFDESKQVAELAAQQITALEQELNCIAETLGGSVDFPMQKHPNYLAAAAELKQALLDLSRTDVKAPMAGIVSKPPKPGQYLSMGSTALALVASGSLWVEANFTETELTHMHPGQVVVIHVDTYPEHEWRGQVESLSPATGAEFSVLPAQNATGNWIKIAQRVPLKIRIQDNNNAPVLRAGLSAVVQVQTEHRRKILGFAL